MHVGDFKLGQVILKKKIHSPSHLQPQRVFLHLSFFRNEHNHTVVGTKKQDQTRCTAFMLVSCVFDLKVNDLNKYFDL